MSTGEVIMANKIIRTSTRAEGGLTAVEKARMDEHASSWISHALRTDTVDRVELTAAIKDLYAVSGQDEPIVVIVPSPDARPSLNHSRH